MSMGLGVLRIARKVAPDRVISTVDPEARHGHKTSHRGFDGYKGHIAVDPDAEIITATEVTAGNTGDAEPVADLITDLTDATEPAEDTAAVYGDAAYGAGEVLDRLDAAGIDIKTKVQPPNAPAGKFTKDRFDIGLQHQQVTCPGGVTIPIRPVRGHDRNAGRGRLRHRLRHLAAARALHRLQDRAQHHHRPPRSPPHHRPHPPNRPRLASRLPHHPTRPAPSAR